MTNILDSLTTKDNNIIGAKKLNNNTTARRNIGVLEAPQSLYKYSLNKTLKEKDEFRRQHVAPSSGKTISGNKKTFPWKTSFVLAAVSGFLLFKKLKH